MEFRNSASDHQRRTSSNFISLVKAEGNTRLRGLSFYEIRERENMKPIAKSIVLSVAACTVSFAFAFGPRLEPLSNGHSYTPRHTVRLHASDSEEDERKGSCQSDFDFAAAEFETIDNFPSLFCFDGIFPLLQKEADALALEAFDLSDECGDDCIECEIPQDWGVPQKTINVMEYLGVTRAKPLR